MKKARKIMALVLAVVICMSMGCMGTFAADEIPAGLPEGAVKIAEGIYKYTPSIAVYNARHWTNIGTVPAIGTIVQPAAFNNIIVDQGHEWLCVSASDVIRINLVSGTQTVFGSNVFNWVPIGGSERSIYYIHADSYNIVKGRAYQLQCTSQTASACRNTEFRYYSYPTDTAID